MTSDAFYLALEPLTKEQRQQLRHELSLLNQLISQSYRKEPREFAEIVITWLSNYCGAVKGAFWDMSSESGALKFRAGFACIESQLHKSVLSIDDDALYQPLIKNHEVILVEGMEGVFMDTATIKMPVSAWIAMPVCINNNLLAAIELYHPARFTNYHLHLLWNAIVSIAASWAGAVEQERRKALIERLHRQNEEIRTQEEELRQQTEELQTTNEHLEKIKEQLEGSNQDLRSSKFEVEKKNKSIMASIQYAKRIQNAMLPSREVLQDKLGKTVLLFFPRDIVSGDFYWLYENTQGTWVAVVDCTGHGVPAALMSMMGINLLEHIISTEEGLTPGSLLNRLDQSVRELLRSDKTNTQDGMDVALCLIDQENQKIHYSGAMRPAYYLSNKGMEVLKHTRRSIGGHGNLKKPIEFEDHSINIEGNSMLYMCSDGYQDQFGGDNDTKFLRKNLLALLKEIWQLPESEQEHRLTQAFQCWKGRRRQTDDVLLMGLRI